MTLDSAHATAGPGRLRLVPGAFVLATAALLAPSPSHAEEEEFAPFRVTDVYGSLALSGDRDTASSGLAGDPAETQTDRRGALLLKLGMQSFIYHPNFLTLDAVFGASQRRQTYTTEAGGRIEETTANTNPYDLSLTASMFRSLPYPATLFYERLNPAVSVGPAAVMQQQTLKHGLQFALLDPLTPVPLSASWQQLRSLGRGAGQVVDDRADRYSLGADAAIGRLGRTRLAIDGGHTESQSGSSLAPIVRSSSRNLGTTLDTRLAFGQDQRWRLTNLLSFNGLRYGQGLNVPADRREARGFLDLRLRQSEQLQAYATLDASRVDQGTARNRSGLVSTGLSWWPHPQLATTLEARSERRDATEFSSTASGLSGSADYQRKLAGGRAQAAYALRFEQRSQSASVPTTAVIGERHPLGGVALVALDRLRVVAGSVQLANEARTQVFVEGRDYLLSVVGVQTRLQRLVSGDIVDGQTVLVDYSIDVGGSFDSTQVDQSLNLLWTWRNLFSVYARWFDAAPKVTAGLPLLTLNTVHGRTLGLRADVPLGLLWSAGGSFEREDRRETILPFSRTSSDAYLQWEEALIGQGGIRLGARRSRVAYDFSSQDVALDGWDLRYWVYTSWGAELQADWSSERDNGAPIPRRRDFGSLRARWSYRQLLVTLALTQTREDQGVLRTRRTLARWLVQRSF